MTGQAVKAQRKILRGIRLSQERFQDICAGHIVAIALQHQFEFLRGSHQKARMVRSGRAGFPNRVAPSGTFLVTTEPSPIREPRPMVTRSLIETEAARRTSSSSRAPPARTTFAE